MDARNSDFQFITSASEKSATLADEIAQLWRKNGVVANSEIPLRLNQVTLVCVYKNLVVGVATTRTVQHKLFDNNLFYEFRCFIDPEYRRPGLDTVVIIKTKEFLEVERRKCKIPPIGILMVVENEELKKWTNAVWRGADMYFAGITSVGHHLRVGYFKRALLLPNGS